MFTVDADDAGCLTDPPARIRELTAADCYDRLAMERVGRIVYTADALPAITPVNYALDGRHIVFRTSMGSRLARGVAGQVVAFEVDHLDRDLRTGWSVVMIGVARPLQDDTRAAALQIAPWAGGRRDLFLQITMATVTGRAVGDEA